MPGVPGVPGVPEVLRVPRVPPVYALQGTLVTLGASPSNRNIGHTACGCVSVMVDRAFREQSRAAGRSCR